ncbi:MAG: flagellar filament capping protein FliD [Peptococcaceae bacterium]|nr:flagellar filament capping protein FliD [Peptococcaceae bacterium]
MYSTTGLNLSGLSGYDFSGIIQAMVDSYKLPQNRIYDKVSKLTTQKSAWQDINTKLAALETALEKLQDPQIWKSTAVTTPAGNNYFSVAGNGSGIQGNYLVNISQIAQSDTVVSRELTDAALASFMDGSLAPYVDDGTTSNWDFKIKVNSMDEAITVHVVKSNPESSAPTLQDIVNSINRAGAGVKASLIQTSSGNYRIAFISSQTGEANGITFEDPNSFLKTIGVLNENGTISDYAETGLTDPSLGGRIQRAQNAVFTVNGLQITSASNTVNGAIEGVTLTLNSPGQSTVLIATDNSAAEKAVKDFVDAYNAVQAALKKYMNYNSETKQAGILLGDSAAQNIQAALRQKVGLILGDFGQYMMLSQVGITSSRSGELSFDKTKFADALAADPQSVANLFGASYDGVKPADDQGLANILRAYLKPLTKYGGTLASRTSMLDEQIKELNDQIERLNEKAAVYEENLKIKFASLEASLSSFQSQASWLAAQLNSLYYLRSNT